MENIHIRHYNTSELQAYIGKENSMKIRLVYIMTAMVFTLFTSTTLAAEDSKSNVIPITKITTPEPNDLFRDLLIKAEAGDAESQYELGLRYYHGTDVSQDYREAIKWYTKAAEQGHALSQLNLGMMYDEGKGVPQDYKEAAKWYTKAAEQGLAPAQSNLGLMYAEGQGVPQDYIKAVQWYTKAAKQGYAKAQYNLGAMYANGYGVPEDYIEAYKWINLSAAQGEELAVKIRDILRKQMSPSQIAEAQRLSREFKPKTKGQIAPDDPALQDSEMKGAGTGFFITSDGYLLTAYHVARDTSKIQVFTAKGLYTAKVIRLDAANDIALLKVDGQEFEALPVQTSREVKVGQEVFTLGFPNIQLQGTEAKYTQGNISSLSGIADDPRLFQISAAVQPGNSGGPLLDNGGIVVGLVVAKLDEIATAKETGSLPQNVNYALKSSFILSFLESVPAINDKLLQTKNPGLSRPQVVEKVGKAVVMVQCY
jgi:TPR repeat protein